MAETEAFINDPDVYGYEIDTPVIRQQVDGRDTSYKTFIKDGEVTILPIDYTGAVLPNAKPIYKDGVWLGPITAPGTQQVGRGSYKNIATIDGISPIYDDSTPPQIIGYSGPLNDQLKESVRQHSLATGTEVPAFSQVNEGNYTNSIPDQIARLKAEVAGANGRDKKSLWIRINRLQEQYDRTEQLVKEEAGGGTGLVTRGLHDYDTDNDIMFTTPVKYPMDMSLQQDHFSIQCYSYQPPYATAMVAGNVGSAYGIQRSSPYRKKLGAGIKLPMPNNMIDGNSRNWEEDNINLQAMEAIRESMSQGTLKILANKLGMGNVTAFFSNALNTGRSLTQRSGRQELMANEISQLVGNMGYDVSADSLLARSGGVIANANTELMFAGVSLRSFEFSWVMSPRDRREAGNVRMILRALKQWSAPRKLSKLASGESGEKAGNTGRAGGPSYFLGTPNIFRLRYLTAGNRNILGVNKFKPCALTDININYTPEGMWMAYEGGMPVSVQMSLKFNELEPIYNTDYSDDIIEKRRFDETNNPMGDLMPISVIRQDTPYSADVGY